MREKTTTTRRVVLSKQKTKPNQHQPNKTPSRPYNPAQKAVPVLFDRQSLPRAPIAVPALWWCDWKTISVTTGFVVLLLCAIYFAPQSSAYPKQTKPEPTQQDVLKPPPEINIRPMGYASTRLSSGIEMRQSSAGGSVNDGRLDRMPVAKLRSGAWQPSGSDELNLVTLDQSNSLLLPHEASGNCSIGKNSLGDLSRCLVVNGARVVR